MSVQTTIASELLAQFPNAANKTLARVALRDNPSVFKDAEAARALFRRMRGASGERNRNASDKTFHRPPGKPGDPFGKIPEGITHLGDWAAFEIVGPAKVLILSDIHFPFHHRGALVSALNWARKNGVETVLLNGDTADFFSISRWEKDPRKRNFAGEIKTTVEFLEVLRAQFKGRIVLKIGNHEERFESYMYVKAPELLGIPQFSYEGILETERLGIEIVKDKRRIRLGNLNVIHGHEYKFAISNPVNAARGLFLRAKVYALCGHFHQMSYHTEKTLEQDTIATWSTGCLCDMHPDYAPLNNWSHGFAFVEVYGDGRFTVQNLKVSGGEIY
jgi:predicted phosphodiesterase